MKAFFAAVTLFAVSAVTSAQKNIVLLDADDRTPVAFAVVRQGEAGVYSDGNGMFETKTFNDGNPVEISMMGYETRRFKIGSADTIYLKAVAINLPEVEVTSAKRELLVINPPATARLIGDWPLGVGTETFAVIIPRKQERKLLKLSIPFLKPRDRDMKRFEGSPVIRVNIYEVEGAGKGARIYSGTAKPIGNPKRSFLEIDLENEGIYLGLNGLCVGVEMVGNIRPDGTLAEDEYYLSPCLTGKKNKDFKISTYFKIVFYSDKPIPITKFINDHMPPGVVVSERNLSIGMVLR